MGGGWRRIVKIDVSAGDDCPSEWHKDTHSGVSFCRVLSDSPSNQCSSANFSTNGISYKRVCGKARGYQKGDIYGFNAYNFRGQRSIDQFYAAGVLISHGNPRQHIWSYVVARFDDRTDSSANCPCAPGGGPGTASFVGGNYCCESGSVNTFSNSDYHINDPLWDGSDCYSSTSCCVNPLMPWFYQEFSKATTSDIEARICHGYDFPKGSPLIDQLELYIQ